MIAHKLGSLPTRDDLEATNTSGCKPKGCRCSWHKLSRMTMDDQMLAALQRKAEWSGNRERGDGSCTQCGAQNVPKFYMVGSKCKACTAIATRQRTYNITPDQQEALLKLQNGICAGCLQHQRIKSLAADHDHASGLMRGLLCQDDNQLIGAKFDSPLAFLRLAVYLIAPPARQIGIGEPMPTRMEIGKTVVDMLKIILEERDL